MIELQINYICGSLKNSDESDETVDKNVDMWR